RAHLTLVGDGLSQALLVKRVQTLGIAEYVRFVPPQTSWGVSRWLAAANVLALPSYAEGCPNVVLEAVSCGRPVVATNVGGISEIVNEQCAVLIPPHDVPALTAALESALNREWDEQKIACQFGRSWEDMAQELYGICCSVFHARPAQAQSRSTSVQRA